MNFSFFPENLLSEILIFLKKRMVQSSVNLFDFYRKELSIGTIDQHYIQLTMKYPITPVKGAAPLSGSIKDFTFL